MTNDIKIMLVLCIGGVIELCWLFLVPDFAWKGLALGAVGVIAIGDALEKTKPLIDGDEQIAAAAEAFLGLGAVLIALYIVLN